MLNVLRFLSRMKNVIVTKFEKRDILQVLFIAQFIFENFLKFKQVFLSMIGEHFTFQSSTFLIF